MHEKVLNTTNRLENANQNNQNANHLTPVRMAVIRKTRTSAGYNRDQREPWYTVSKDVNYIATAENNMLVPQKGKNRTTIPSSNSISRYLPKGNKITLSKRYLHSHGHCISSVQFSRSVVSDSLWPHEPQHARPPCPSPTPGVHSNSCPSSRWCHPAISSSVVPFSSCPQSLPASESFPISQLFSWGGQSIGVSASASVLPINLPGLISFRMDWLVHCC